MATPTFHGETMSPLFGHATEWTLTHDGRPVHVFMHNPHHETPQFVITAMDTHRKFRQTSKRGRGIVALIRDAYKQRFAGLHFDDADAEPEFGYTCKHCHGPAPVGIGYVADGADAAARSEGLTACECGYSTTDVEEAHPDQTEKIIDLLKEIETRIPHTPKEETMSDQTTHITPNLTLEKDAYGVPEILLDGETLHESIIGGDYDENMQELFRILTSMTYTRRNGNYWADWQGGEDFWTSGISLHDAVEQAAKGIALFLTGQNGYPLFGEKTSLKAVK